MSTFLKIFYSPMDPFIRHPELAYFVAAGFVILWAVCVWHSGTFRPRLYAFILLPALLWVLYGMHEYRAQAAGWNIRVDILMIWPVLFVASAAAVWLSLRELIAPRRTAASDIVSSAPDLRDKADQ